MKVLLVLMLCSIGVFAQDDVEEAIDWITHETADFSVIYPSDWELDESGNMNTSFILFSAPDADDDDFTENVNLMIQDMSSQGDMTMKEYATLSEQQVKQYLGDAKMLKNEVEQANNREYLHMVYTANQGGRDLKFEQYIWLVNNKAYVLTLTTEKSMYNIYKETGLQILNSFMIK